MIDQLAEIGTREIVFIGGEAFLRKDWIEIIEYAAKRDILCGLQTGGRGLSRRMLAAARDRGLSGVGYSLDGLSKTHDYVRGVEGSFDAVLEGLSACTELRINTSINTQIHSKNITELEEIFDLISEYHVQSWQIQLTVAMGNAADNTDILLQPYDLLEIMPVIAKLYEKSRNQGTPRLIAGNNIGYFGPYEHLWRGPDLQSEAYSGCGAGVNGIGIEADGKIKGCPSLASSRYTEGNIRESSLKELWESDFHFKLNRGKNVSLSGYCAECYYGEVCRGGCAWTSDSLFGAPGNNPFCHHRALELSKRGVKERIVKIREADKSSFGTGEYALIQERFNESIPNNM